MAHYEVICAERPRRHGTKDAVVLDLQVRRNGEYFQFACGTVSGPELAGVQRQGIALDTFWSFYAQAALDLIEEDVRAGRLPLDEATDPAAVTPHVDSVIRGAGRSPIPPPLRDGDIIGTFDA